MINKVNKMTGEIKTSVLGLITCWKTLKQQRKTEQIKRNPIKTMIKKLITWQINVEVKLAIKWRNKSDQLKKTQ